MPPQKKKSKKKSEPPIYYLLGLPFHRVSTDEAVQDCAEMLEWRSRARYVVGADIQSACTSWVDKRLRWFFFGADRILCRSSLVHHHSNWVGTPLPQRVALSEVVPRLLEYCALRGLTVSVLARNARAKNRITGTLELYYPRLHTACHDVTAGGQQVLKEIAQAEPRMLLVALSAREENYWISSYLSALKVPLTIGLGPDVCVITGKWRRLQRFLRVLSAPWRFGAGAFSGSIFLIRRAWHHWMTRPIAMPEEPLPPEEELPDGYQIIYWHKIEEVPVVIAGDRGVICDCTRAKGMNPAELGHLVTLARTIMRCGHPFLIYRPPADVKRILCLQKLDTVLPVCQSVREIAEAISRRKELQKKQKAYAEAVRGRSPQKRVS